MQEKSLEAKVLAVRPPTQYLDLLDLVVFVCATQFRKAGVSAALLCRGPPERNKIWERVMTVISPG